MLDPEWVEAHADDFDLFHVQFGFDGRHPEQLASWSALLAEQGKPLVYTVHDLRNPNHEERGLHDAQMAVLVEAADGAGDADRARRGGDRGALRPPRRGHPPPPRRPARPARRSLRGAAGSAGRRARGRRPPEEHAGEHGRGAAAAALTAERAVGDARLPVDVHEEIWDPQAPAFRGDLRTTLEHLARREALDLRLHGYFSDPELYDYLAALDVAILPYRFGTHSGWLEACRDLGTAVVAPDCGCYAAQGPVFTFHCDEDGLDAGEPPRRRRRGRSTRSRRERSGPIRTGGATDPARGDRREP